jgi:predicted nucleic acid-binding protein
MIIVLDTSAAAEIVLQRENSVSLGKNIVQAEWVITPTLFISEITNVFWKYYVFKDMPLELCEQAIDRAVSLPDEFVSEKDLYKEAFSLGCLTQKPIYDMYFLVLARRNNAYLMTMDISLKKIAKKNSIRLV